MNIATTKTSAGQKLHTKMKMKIIILKKNVFQTGSACI